MALEKYKQKRNFTVDAGTGGRSEARGRAREEGEAGEGPVLLRAEAPRQPSALRLPPRAQRRAAVVGGAEGTVARSEDQAARDARRGSPDRVRRRSKASSPKATAPASSCSGTSGTWTPRGRRCRRGAEEGRPEVHARRLQAEGLVGAGAHQRPYAGARGGGDRSWLLIKHRDDWAGDVDITEFAPLSVKSDGDFEDILAAGQRRTSGRRTGRPRAARPARCSRRSSSAPRG